MAHILLDTHVILFALSAPNRLNEAARELISNPENSIYFSPISIWEIAVKHDKHPEDMPVSVDETLAYCIEAGYRELLLNANETCLLSKLDSFAMGPVHKDPFDRMLMCQALANEMLLLTRNSDILAYGLEETAKA